jgi:hypothetical protein
MKPEDVTLVVSVVGIATSGVVGPQFTAWATRRANRLQFDRQRVAERLDDLRNLVDEAAVLLATGATNLRLLAQGASTHPADWIQQVFPLGQRLRLRLPEDHAVVKAYDAVREALTATGGAAADELEAHLVDFETKRSTFLQLARDTLNSPIAEGRASWM